MAKISAYTEDTTPDRDAYVVIAIGGGGYKVKNTKPPPLGGRAGDTHGRYVEPSALFREYRDMARAAGVGRSSKFRNSERHLDEDQVGTYGKDFCLHGRHNPGPGRVCDHRDWRGELQGQDP